MQTVEQNTNNQTTNQQASQQTSGINNKKQQIIDKINTLQAAIKQKKQQAQQIKYLQEKQQQMNVYHEIKKQQAQQIRERNNLSANILRENFNNYKNIKYQAAEMENLTANQDVQNIGRQEALKNKLDKDFDENTKDTKMLFAASAGGAALLSALSGAGGAIGSIAGTLAPTFMPLLIIVAIFAALKYLIKLSKNLEQKQEIENAYAKARSNIKDPKYISNFMQQFDNIGKEQNKAFDQMVSSFLEDTGLSEENQKTAKGFAMDFAEKYDLNNIDNMSPEQIEEQKNELTKQLEDIIAEEKANVTEKEKDNETSKGNNKQNLGNSFAEEVIKPAVQKLNSGIKKEKTGAKFAISGVNEKQGKAQPAQGGKMNKDKGVAIAKN